MTARLGYLILIAREMQTDVNKLDLVVSSESAR